MIAPIAVTCGDISGVAIEITQKAWRHFQHGHPFFVIGDPDHYRFGDGVPTQVISSPDEAALIFESALPVLPISFASSPIFGSSQPENAATVKRSIELAVQYTQQGLASAVCTNPINKEILHSGCDFPFPGHTEFLAHLAGKDFSVMMLTAPELSVVPVTIHIPISKVKSELTPDVLMKTIQVVNTAMQRDFGVASPRITVAGLNPHAGENGRMGTEEIEFIRPLINRLAAEGMSITGPKSADTMFHAAARETYDVAICMYHDQALIPIKTLNFSGGVNVTLGLPFIRTSPDHGTAFDIAGHRKADATSLIQALEKAHDMSAKRREFDER